MIISLEVGQFITTTRNINPKMVSHWRYARDCQIGGGLLLGAKLTVVEVSKTPGEMWVRARMPGDYSTATLKISGEEFSWNFRPEE